MHQHRILSRISLVLSVLNLVLAAPIVVYATRGDDRVEEEEDAASLHSSQSQDTIESPQHPSLSDTGSTSSGYLSPYLSSGSEKSGSNYPAYAWLLKRPPRPSLNPPASLQDLALATQTAPHPSIPGPPEIPLPAWMQGLTLAEIPPSPPAAWRGWFPPLPPSSSSGSSEISHTELYLAPADAYSEFMSSNSGPPSSFLSDDPLPWTPDEPIPTPELIAIPSHNSMSEGLVPPDHLASDASPPPPSPPSASPPSETLPDDSELFNKNMMKKAGIIAGAAITGITIAGLVGSQIKHHEHRDCQNSDSGGKF